MAGVEDVRARVEADVERLRARSAAPRAPWPRELTAPLPAHAVRTPAQLAPHIDHTLLKPEAGPADVERLAREAREHGFAGVCVNSAHVALVARLLEGSAVRPVAVAGFPLGAMLPAAKAFEAREAVRCGAREVDMVLQVGALKAGDLALVLDDIAGVVQAAAPWPVKVILETGLLTQEEKVAGCVLARAAGAAFVKTSSGFGVGGATLEDVALMRQVVGEGMGVKASGGIRSAEAALRLVAAGANRLGASASVALVTGEAASAAATGRY